MADMKDEVVKMIADMVKKAPDDISGQSRLTQDLGLKSANRIGLSALLEETFNITISLFEIMKVKTIDDLVKLIESKQI